MTVLGLDHVQLAIPAGGEDQARAFWVGLLGLAEVPKPPQLSPAGCWFTGGSLSLHLGVDKVFRPATKAHPALLVDDIDAVAEQVGRHGFPTVWDAEFPGYRRFYTADGNGNRVEILGVG